jgi:hypothetical protein
MKFFFPDAQDLVDPSFDFETETRSEDRQRQRDDLYAHEVFAEAPYDGLLVSRAIVEGHGNDGSRYTLAQRQRLLRGGARAFFRLEGRPLQVMGDCGAFSYVREKVPPVTVEQVIDFYEACGFDYGVSVDHIILAYEPESDDALPGLGVELLPEDWAERQRITLELAADFLRRHRERRCRFTPIGVAQGWSPRSYARSVEALQAMGYTRIGLGGMVPLKTHEVLACLKAVAAARRPETQFHLFGVTRCAQTAVFRAYGVTSFDSTSPLKQAFKDDRDNYYAPERSYTAVRVPQIDVNPKLQRRILAGEVDRARALRLERACLDALIAYDRGGRTLDETLDAVREYELLHDGRRDRSAAYRETLDDRPWKDCPCAICRQIGIHVVLFRGAERNRRRGFHNVFVTYRQLHRALADDEGRPATAGETE